MYILSFMHIASEISVSNLYLTLTFSITDYIIYDIL